MRGPQFVPVIELSRRVGLSATTLRKHAEAGRIPAMARMHHRLGWITDDPQRLYAETIAGLSVPVERRPVSEADVRRIIRETISESLPSIAALVVKQLATAADAHGKAAQ